MLALLIMTTMSNTLYANAQRTSIPTMGTTLAPLVPISYAPTTTINSSPSLISTMTTSTSSLLPTSTISSSNIPSLTPTIPLPSMVPSYTSISSVSRRCQQTIEVEEPIAFTDVQIEIYQLLMQSYTIQLGALVIEPDVVTVCNVTEQEVAGGSPPDDTEVDGQRRRRRRTSTTSKTSMFPS